MSQPLQDLRVIEIGQDTSDAEVEAVFRPLVGLPIYKADIPKQLTCGIACPEAGVVVLFRITLLHSRATTLFAGRTLREWCCARQELAPGTDPV